jgi:hypothetical protein
VKKLFLILLFCSPVFGITDIQNAFNAGELSPLLDGRTDIEKYYSGAREIENFLVLSYGGVEKRPGTKFINTVRNQAEATRLLQFEFSITDSYVIEAGNLYFRFYKDGGQILNGITPVTVTTPYITADLWEIQFIQSADTMYIVHPDYAPRTLTRSSDTSWTLAAIDFERGPFLTENSTTTTIEPNATTGTIDLVASDDIWNANHVGALWQITHTVDANEASIALTTGAAQNSTENTVQLGRKFDFSTHGTWTGTVYLQRSYDSGSTWKTVRPVHYEDDGNITYSDSETVDDAIYRIHKDASGITSGTCNANFVVRSFDVDGVVEITAYTDANNVTATVDYTLGDTTATAVWAEGAFSDDEGFPSALAFYQERLCLAGTTNNPQTIWMSVTDDWNNFLAGDLDSSSLIFTIAADQVNVIRWLAPQTALLVGTVGAEWKLAPSESGKPLTVTNVELRRQSSYGSAYIQPVMSNNIVLYAQRQAQKIRELVFSFAEDAWVSPDLTILSEHITDTGITEMALQKTPDTVLWCVRDDGELCAMTYERDQNVMGWHRHTFDGVVESVAVIPGDGEDEVWLTVRRTIGGETRRFIEQFQQRKWEEQEDAFYVDSGLTFDGGVDVNITDITSDRPAVVTAPDHGFSDGDQVRIDGVVGMPQINDLVFTVDSPTRDILYLRDSTDSVDWGSGGLSDHSYNKGEGSTQLRLDQSFTPACTYTPTGLRVYCEWDYSGLNAAWEIRITGQLDIYESGVATARFTGPGWNDADLTFSGWLTFDELSSASPDPIFEVEAGTEYGIDVQVTAQVYVRATGAYVSTLTSTKIVYGADGYSRGNITAINNVADSEEEDLDVAFEILTDTASCFTASGYVSGGYVRQVENTFSMPHLEGEEIVVMGDGGVADANETIVVGDTGTVGQFRLKDYYNTVHAGLSYESQLLTRRLELPSASTLQGRTKRIHEITLRFVDSLACKVGGSFTETDRVIFRDAADSLEASLPLYTGDKLVGYDGDYETDASIYILSDEPVPLTITAVIPRFDVGDD